MTKMFLELDPVMMDKLLECVYYRKHDIKRVVSKCKLNEFQSEYIDKLLFDCDALIISINLAQSSCFIDSILNKSSKNYCHLEDD